MTDTSQRIESSTAPRANVLGIGVHAIDMNCAVQLIHSAVDRSDKGYVCVTGVHGIMEAQRDRDLKDILDRAMLVTPDGMPTVWIGRLQGFHAMRRVFGPDLMLEVCRSSVSNGYTHFLYGGNEGVAEELKANLETMFPGIRIVGTYTPPFRPLTPAEETEIAAEFDRVNPDITWIGLSTPKQERFMSEYLAKLNTRVMVGVGAAFDVHTGRIKDSPQWIKQSGLQWAHRLIQEPRRLWKRYCINNPKFSFLILMQLLGLRRYQVGR